MPPVEKVKQEFVTGAMTTVGEPENHEHVDRSEIPSGAVVVAVNEEPADNQSTAKATTATMAPAPEKVDPAPAPKKANEAKADEAKPAAQPAKGGKTVTTVDEVKNGTAS